MKINPLFFAIAIVLLVSFPTSGEYYQYIDKDGTLRYTDDASLIPDDEVPNAVTYESVKSESVPQLAEPEAVVQDNTGPAVTEEESEAIVSEETTVTDEDYETTETDEDKMSRDLDEENQTQPDESNPVARPPIPST